MAATDTDKAALVALADALFEVCNATVEAVMATKNSDGPKVIAHAIGMLCQLLRLMTDPTFATNLADLRKANNICLVNIGLCLSEKTLVIAPNGSSSAAFELFSRYVQEEPARAGQPCYEFPREYVETHLCSELFAKVHDILAVTAAREILDAID